MDAPALDEIEISLFGPGYGECVVVHLGDNDWIIVDSCIDYISKKPQALQYLNSINLDPSFVVKQVIATHWHDDHIRGLGRLFEECKSSEFVISAALRRREFLTLVSAYKHDYEMQTTGISELRKIINILKERDKSYPIFALANRKIWSNQNSEKEIYSLSPSDAGLEKGYLAISKLIPKEGESILRLPDPDPNGISVALLIKVLKSSILLGADLEVDSNPNLGWNAVINSTERPSIRSSVYKISHHGSANGDIKEIWTKMLLEKPNAILTPFSKGNKKLPTIGDIKRICNQTPNSYITVPPELMNRRKKKQGIVGKQIRGTVKNISSLNSPYGHIRIRKKIYTENSSSNWNIQTFGVAKNFC